jgi:nucleoside diphosphate-linked moiety X motif protein 19
VPDLWAVKEWSDWLTPTDLNDQCKRRFDTIFYTACLDSIPTTMLDQAEVTAVLLTYLASLLHKFYERQFWLAPPQVY